MNEKELELWDKTVLLMIEPQHCGIDYAIAQADKLIIRRAEKLIRLQSHELIRRDGAEGERGQPQTTNES